MVPYLNDNAILPYYLFCFVVLKSPELWTVCKPVLWIGAYNVPGAWHNDQHTVSMQHAIKATTQMRDYRRTSECCFICVDHSMKELKWSLSTALWQSQETEENKNSDGIRMQKWPAWSEHMLSVTNKTARTHRSLNDYGI